MHRRTLFKLGLTSAAVLVVAGSAAALLQPGLNQNVLSPTGRMIFLAVGRAVLDKSLPQQDDARETALKGLLDRIDGLIGGLPRYVQSELSQLLALLGSSAGRRALAGLNNLWDEATVAQVQQALQGMRLSRMALRQQAYAALHDISAGAYFADPSSWSVLGYPGPLKI